jgi:predicted nuclease of predicted toxin-antitoxin system
MKLLFDQNISHKIILHITDIISECTHVSAAGLHNFQDIEIWNFAKENGFIIVTLDSDFINFATLYRCPPKVIIIKNFNASTRGISEKIRQAHLTISEFAESDDCVLIIR